MINPKEQSVLFAYDPRALLRLADAFDAFHEAKQRDELAAIVEGGRIPVSAKRRDKAVKELQRLRDMGAPDILLRHQAYLSDPKSHVLARIRDHDAELTFEELTGFIQQDKLVVWDAGISWGLAPKRRTEVDRALRGSGVCVLAGKPRLPHWREGREEDTQRRAREQFGDAWNHNFHNSLGVAQAHTLLSQIDAPMATTEDAADCPSYRYRMILTHGYAKKSKGYVFGGATSPWPEDPRPEAAKALRLVAKQLPSLRTFYETCHDKGRHVLCAPRAL
jgi:hypothetical protein